MIEEYIMEGMIIGFGKGRCSMARRPVYCSIKKFPYVKVVDTEFNFYSGFSISQRQKSINDLHLKFSNKYPNYRVLEVSSKSDEDIGVQLSAFNLMVRTSTREFSVESAFQSSKVFQNGGPYTDLLEKTSKEAKRDERLRSSGKLISFNYFGRTYPLEPKDFFYNWIYINALHLQQNLVIKLLEFDAFTDIEFNPQKSINCQAKAVALYVSLYKSGVIDKALDSQDSFLRIVYGINEDEKVKNHQEECEQISLFGTEDLANTFSGVEKKKISIIDKCIYEFEEISYVLNNLENGRIYEKTGWTQDGYLSTNIQKLRKLMISLIEKSCDLSDAEKKEIKELLDTKY